MVVFLHGVMEKMASLGMEIHQTLRNLGSLNICKNTQLLRSHAVIAILDVSPVETCICGAATQTPGFS